MLAVKETKEPNLIVSYRPILTSANQPIKGAKIPEKHCDAVRKTGEVKFKYAAHDSIRLLENENNACHRSRSNIFLLQHKLKDLFQCLQQADSALRKSIRTVYCSCATGS